MTTDKALQAALDMGESPDLFELEAVLMRDAAAKYGLAKYLGGTTDISGAMQGLYGPLAERLGNTIYEAVILASANRDTPLTDANAIDRIMEAAAGDFADMLPNEPDEYGPGSLADADDPAGSDAAHLADQQSTERADSLFSHQKDHAVASSMRRTFSRESDSSPVLHDNEALRQPDTRIVGAADDPLGEAFEKAFPAKAAEETIRKLLP